MRLDVWLSEGLTPEDATSQTAVGGTAHSDGGLADDDNQEIREIPNLDYLLSRSRNKICLPHGNDEENERTEKKGEGRTKPRSET
jgi:hypothetical protein